MITSQTVQQVIVLTNKETSSGNVLGGEGHYLEGGGGRNVQGNMSEGEMSR